MAGKTKTEAVNHLRAWREYRHLSQVQLAELAGTHSSSISELESGKLQLSPKWLRLLAPALGITPGFLLDHTPEDADSAFLAEALAVPKEDRGQLVDIFQSFRKKAR